MTPELTDAELEAQLPPRDDGRMYLWVIYDHPSDSPRHFIVRPQSIPMSTTADRDESIEPWPYAWGFVELEKAREFCEQFGLACIARDPRDDPTIVETWI